MLPLVAEAGAGKEVVVAKLKCKMDGRPEAGPCGPLTDGSDVDFLVAILVEGEVSGSLTLCMGHMCYWHNLVEKTVRDAWSIERQVEDVLEGMGE